MKNILFATLAAGFSLMACRSVKKIQTVLPKTDTTQPKPAAAPVIFDSAAFKKSVYEKVNAHHIDFTWFLGKIKLDYDDSKGKSINATAFVRMKKDSVIWLSLTGALGIEGYRILVKPDTVQILDKLHNTVSYKSVSYLRDLIKLPVDFYTLQDLLVGNPVFFSNNIVSYRFSDKNLLALSVGDFFKHLITIDTTDNRILHSKLDDVQENRNRTCDITLGDYNNQQGRLFSSAREITVTEKEKSEIKLDFKQVTFDEPQSFPFNIPKNYNVK